MTKRKPRLEKSRNPNKFSVHLSDSNLIKIKDIQEMEDHLTRNESINFCIDSMHSYYKYRKLIEELRLLGKQGG